MPPVPSVPTSHASSAPKGRPCCTLEPAALRCMRRPAVHHAAASCAAHWGRTQGAAAHAQTMPAGRWMMPLPSV